MPSDDRMDRALKAVMDRAEPFHSAVVQAVDQVHGLLEEPAAPEEGGVRTAAELGPFAAGRIDPERFSSLFSGAESLDEVSRTRIHRALRVLNEVLARPTPAEVVVEPGGDLREAVHAELAGLGRAFGAARAIEAARTGRYRPDEHDEYLAWFPFRLWNRAERGIAPPVVVKVRGPDLSASGLAEFLDGNQVLALVVEGDAPPAPLARLISPSVFVMQVRDPASIGALAGTGTPAIAAILPEGAAEFVWDPGAGPALRDRLTVGALPDPDERALRRMGFQAAEELGLLRMLAGAAGVDFAGVAAETGDGEEPAQPADKLAAWLLRQASIE